MDSLGQDLTGLKFLPEMVCWLQHTVVIHDESEGVLAVSGLLIQSGLVVRDFALV